MKATLVTVDVASADLGKTAKEIFDLVDGGSLLEPALVWVFDLSVRQRWGRRELRFWRMELSTRADGRKLGELELDAVLDRILPEDHMSLTAGELDLLWQMRPRTRLDLNRQLKRRTLKLYKKKDYPRWVLREFLKQRWLGATYERPHWKSVPVVPSRARVSPHCGGRPAVKRAEDLGWPQCGELNDSSGRMDNVSREEQAEGKN